MATNIWGQIVYDHTTSRVPRQVIRVSLKDTLIQYTRSIYSIDWTHVQYINQCPT